MTISAEAVKAVFGNTYDYDSRKIAVGGEKTGVFATMCYIDGLVSGEAISREIIKPATDEKRLGSIKTEGDAITMFLQGLVYSYTARLRTTLSETVDDLMNGYCAILFDASSAAVTFEVKTDIKRSIDEPKEEKSVKGSKDVFIEILKTNTMLIRRKLHDSALRFETVTLGDKTNTAAVIAYLDGYTDTELINEMKRRIQNAKIESALTCSAVEEYISDRPKTPFPQLIRTERPDKFCMNLLEGRVGLLVDGLPMGYLAPGTFSQFFKVPDDVSRHFLVASALTVLRYFAIILALVLPALYVAIVMYHQEMLPLRLLLSIIDSRQAVPFPSAVEVLTMLIAFELLQEAGLRLPNTVGQTVSIIGALIVGQSAVEARVVSPIVVIVVALSGISAYCMPDQDMSAAVRMFRFLLVIAAILGGLFGVILGTAGILYHLCTIESFGTPYMEPFAGGGKKLSAVLRLPLDKTEIKKQKENKP